MSRKKRKPPTKHTSPTRKSSELNIPTYNFFGGMSLDDMWGLQEAVENAIYKLENGDFLAWEAVARHEQGLPLTDRQEQALDGLINFGDPDDQQILYINEVPRPSESWYVILNKIVPHLLIEPFRTSDVHAEVKADGWKRLTTALEEHGQGLSLPVSVTSFKEIVPSDLRHKLWLQYCFESLGGLGQDEDLVLDEDDPWRVDDFIERLRECKESVAFFELTMDSLFARVILPERDRPVFTKLMQERLGFTSGEEPIAGHL